MSRLGRLPRSSARTVDAHVVSVFRRFFFFFQSHCRRRLLIGRGTVAQQKSRSESERFGFLASSDRVQVICNRSENNFIFG